MAVNGAGGTSGGVGRFFIGLVMMIGGGYLFFDAVRVTQHFHMGYALYSLGNFKLTTGLTLVPLIFGVGIIFFNAKNPMGWILTGASLTMIVFGVIASIQFRIRNMSAFELIMILTLLMGGIGLFFSSLKGLEESSAP